MAKATSAKSEESTALTVYNKAGFMALSTDGDMAALLDDLKDVGMELTPADIPRIKFPQGGGTRWEVPRPDGESDLVKEIVGAFVYFQKAAVLWPSFDPAPGTPPVLRSWDCQTADLIGEVPPEMVETIAKYTLPNGKVNIREADGFPYSQWGSGKEGIGKRMKESRMCFVLPPDQPMPFLINVPSGSIKIFDPWFKSLVARMRVHYTATVVGFALDSVPSKRGMDYARLMPRVAGLLDPETRDALRAQWHGPLSAIATKIVDEPHGGGDEG